MEIKVINSDPLFEYKKACLITKGKNIQKCSYPKTFEETVTFWVKNITAGHSCLRFIHFTIIDELPKSVVMQIIRATKGHPQPEVQSSRPDWTGKERSNDPYEKILFTVDYTPESFIEMMKQRLCVKTEKNTRNAVIRWREELLESSDPLLFAIGLCSISKCKYLNCCNELYPCGLIKENLYERFLIIDK